MSLDFDLYVVTDRQLTAGRPLRLVVEAALRGGARAFQLREKDLSPRELYPLALEMRQLTQMYGAHLLINDRVDLALAVDADGVRSTTTSLPATVARQLLGPGRLIGVSPTPIAEAQAAADEGLTLSCLAPSFYTHPKLHTGACCARRPAGRASRGHIPILAIGGVKKGEPRPGARCRRRRHRSDPRRSSALMIQRRPVKTSWARCGTRRVQAGLQPSS